MRIAILGATSQIAKDLVLSFCSQSEHRLALYARRPDAVSQWLTGCGLSAALSVADFAAFHADEHFDAILNFVGVGNPAQALLMGASIFDVTLKFDEMATAYIRRHPACRYVFLSSGAAYGSSFDQPVTAKSRATIAINELTSQDWYAVAKLHAECRHRAAPDLSIVDVRVFNYFSSTQDISARFLITDIVRAVQQNVMLKTSSEYIVRDYIHPSDFHALVNAILESPATNVAVDCYSREPIDKPGLLAAMRDQFGLQYELVQASASIDATGSKPYYYSKNQRAKDFGYQPAFTSLEGIFKEAKKILADPLTAFAGQ